MQIWEFWIDTGGTFTDCIYRDPSGRRGFLKVLSNGTLKGQVDKVVNARTIRVTHKWPIKTDILKGFTFQSDRSKTKISEIDPYSGHLHFQDDVSVLKGDSFSIASGENAPILAIRLATDTRLGSPFPRVNLRLGTTKGTNALLERKGASVALLVTRGFRDLLQIGNQQRPHLFQLDIPSRNKLFEDVYEIEERILSDGTIDIPLDEQDFGEIRKKISLKNPDSIALCLTNSYKNDVHERGIEEMLLSEHAFVSRSSAISKSIHLVPRMETTVVNAYLHPIIQEYLQQIQNILLTEKFKIMDSAGGLVEYQRFQAKDSLLSGPSGGVMGAAHVAGKHAINRFISFDMGGTSTDTSRFDGIPDYQYRTQVGEATILTPSVAIETVAAGGGSICRIKNGRLQVGPESAGAFPGPACYGNGGPLTLTDVHLLLDRLEPSFFSIPLNKSAAEMKFNELFHRFRKFRPNAKHRDVLEGLTRLASQRMAQAIREISIRKGVDPSDHVLIPFGGAGGLHACEIAEILDIPKILFPFEAGVLSALGIGTSPIQRIVEKQVLLPLEDLIDKLESAFRDLEQEGISLLATDEGIHEVVVRERLIYLRLRQQHHTLELAFSRTDHLRESFCRLYRETFGYMPSEISIEVESIKVIVQSNENPSKAGRQLSTMDRKSGSTNWTGIQNLEGPQVIANDFGTLFIAEGWRGEITEHDCIYLSRHQAGKKINPAVRYEMFFNRFESIAREMGAQLQRTAFSVNIKERLDFSCAILDSEGRLLINAPHIPVHLGSLGVCCRLVLRQMSLNPGDTIITNHPKFGGSHLPDITLISGAFSEDGRLIAIVANRAHHAEIGGRTPGSMPIDARNLEEEGVVIPPSYLIQNGLPKWKELEEIFRKSRYPSRSEEANYADIRAAVASLENGKKALQKLVSDYDLEGVQKYMSEIRQSSRRALVEAIRPYQGKRFQAEEHLDDGTPICVSIDFSKDRISMDFAGTGPVHPLNLNANEAIVRSVIIYFLRLLCNREIPLNEGMMEIVDLQLPKCFLNPPFPDDIQKCPAVVGGNTEVSQRLVDTLLKALELAACSQGTMNNLLFGRETFGYYETIGAGTGAGAGFHGRDGVHQHMTNTKITDPEELEFRYPVVLREFGLRTHSGGTGQWHGGEGITRSVEFKENLELTVLTQHRVVPPYGLKGGLPGARGEQYITRATGEKITLSGIDRFDVSKGDILTMLTPGGGGYGIPKEQKDEEKTP